jgi:hypothetical protein
MDPSSLQVSCTPFLEGPMKVAFRSNQKSYQFFPPLADPALELYDSTVKTMNDYLDQINKFESITNNTLVDIWKIKDTAFSPLKVALDSQEYMPGLLDLLQPNEQLELSKILMIFSYLQIETTNLKQEIESKFFDPLILFGENGLVYDVETDEDQTGDNELQMSRMLKVYKDLYNTVRKIAALIKNIIYQMNGLFNSKSKLYINSFKKLIYHEAFHNLGQIMSTCYVIDMIINENSNFKTYWQEYNKMFLVCKNDPTHYNTTDKELKKISKFCSRIYTQILCGTLY